MNVPAAISLGAAIIGLGVGGLAFGVGSARRWAHYRLLSSVAVLASLYCGLDVISTLELRPELLVALTRPQSMVAAFDIVMWHVYADRQLRRPASRLDIVARIVVVLAGVSWLVPDLLLDGSTTSYRVAALGVTYAYATPTVLGIVVFALEVALLSVPFARFVRAARDGVDGAFGHALALAIGLAAAAYDSIVTSGVVRGPFLLPVSFIAAVCVLGALLTRAFIADARALDMMTQRLEQLVEERTKELVATEGALMHAEKLAALGQLSAGVAHEINNPAAAVVGNLEFLREELEDGRAGPDVFASIDDSLDAIDRIAKVVRQLLDVGRAAATAPNDEASSVARLVEEAVATARPSVATGSIVVNGVPEDVFVPGDAPSLVKVLVHLIVNAGHAIAGLDDGRIVIDAAKAGSDVVISVADNGRGMSEETKRRLFEPFYTTKPFGQGRGLGLPWSLGIVRSLGGDLLVDCRRRQTTMRVRLPAVAGLDAEPHALRYDAPAGQRPPSRSSVAIGTTRGASSGTSVRVNDMSSSRR